MLVNSPILVIKKKTLSDLLKRKKEKHYASTREVPISGNLMRSQYDNIISQDK